jgi:hypothetical protein
VHDPVRVVRQETGIALAILRPDPAAELDARRARAASSIGQALSDLGDAGAEVDIDLTERQSTAIA